jgi:acyl-CoA thioester hydrolase
MEDLDLFKLKIEIDVRWGDMDAFKHVNNTVYLKWVEAARVEYLREHIVGDDLRNHRLGPILARTDIRYIYPITYPDRVTVGFRVAEIRDDRLMCECKIYTHEHQRLSAIAYNTVMAYDFEAMRKADIPIGWIMKIQEVED